MPLLSTTMGRSRFPGSFPIPPTFTATETICSTGPRTWTLLKSTPDMLNDAFLWRKVAYSYSQFPTNFAPIPDKSTVATGKNWFGGQEALQISRTKLWPSSFVPRRLPPGPTAHRMHLRHGNQWDFSTPEPRRASGHEDTRRRQCLSTCIPVGSHPVPDAEPVYWLDLVQFDGRDIGMISPSESSQGRPIRIVEHL